MEVLINVEGLMCTGCEKRVESAISSLNEVKKVKANHKDGTVKVILKNELNLNILKEKINDIGFVAL